MKTCISTTIHADEDFNPKVLCTSNHLNVVPAACITLVNYGSSIWLTPLAARKLIETLQSIEWPARE